MSARAHRLGDAGRPVYITGQIEPDAPQVSQMLQEPGRHELVGAMIRHELAHLVGLDHVADPGQLMYPETSSTLRFGPGDLTGSQSSVAAGAPDL